MINVNRKVFPTSVIFPWNQEVFEWNGEHVFELRNSFTISQVYHSHGYITVRIYTCCSSQWTTTQCLSLIHNSKHSQCLQLTSPWILPTIPHCVIVHMTDIVNPHECKFHTEDKFRFLMFVYTCYTDRYFSSIYLHLVIMVF